MVSGSKQADDVCCDANMTKGWMPPFNRREWQEQTVFHLPLLPTLSAFSQRGSGLKSQLGGEKRGCRGRWRRKTKCILLVTLLYGLIP